MSINYGIDENTVRFVQQKTKTTTDETSLDAAKNVTGTDIGFKRALDVAISTGLLSDVKFDYFARVLSGTDNEIETWTYRDGGSGGTVVAVVVATYTDNYRDDLVSVDRTT